MKLQITKVGKSSKFPLSTPTFSARRLPRPVTLNFKRRVPCGELLTVIKLECAHPSFVLVGGLER